MSGFGSYATYLKWSPCLSTFLFIVSLLFFTYYFFKVRAWYLSDKLMRVELIESKIKAFGVLLLMMVLINLLYLSYQTLYTSVVLVELVLFHGFFKLFLKR